MRRIFLKMVNVEDKAHEMSGNRNIKMRRKLRGN